jgi:phage terminase large subunit
MIVWGVFREINKDLKPGAKIAIESANGIGKTEWCAGIACWFMEVFEQNKCLTTGSSWSSLEEHLWPRIHKFIETGKLFQDAEVNQMEVNLGSEYGRAFARSTDKAERIAGAHAPYLMQIVEEASGISEEIADAIDGNDTGEFGIQIWVGNPLKSKGSFRDRCHKDKSFKSFRISAFDHPNIIEGREVIPGAVSRKKVHENAEKWCIRCAPNTPEAVHLFWLGDEGWYIPSNRFRSRVMGAPPSVDDDVLISESLLERAKQRTPPVVTKLATGCDIARFGTDDTVIVNITQNGIIDIERLHGKRTTDTAGRLIRDYRIEPRTIATDDGGVGGGVSDMLSDAQVPYLPVNFGQAAEDPKTYANLKAQIYWEFKLEIERNPDFHIPDDDDLITQASTIKYGYDRLSRVMIETKEEYRKRTGKSPDTLEAVLLALYALKRSAVLQPRFGSVKRNTNFRALGIGSDEDDDG